MSREQGGPPPEAASEGLAERFEFTAADEERIVERVAAAQEAMMKAIRAWTHETHAQQPIDAVDVWDKMVRLSSSWERFIIMDILGISKERFEDILRQKGFM
jgi:hypothetical protein